MVEVLTAVLLTALGIAASLTTVAAVMSGLAVTEVDVTDAVEKLLPVEVILLVLMYS